MRATLVAFYGNKPNELVLLLRHLQSRAADLLGDRLFTPYGLEQVHGTVVGLETANDVTGGCNRNYRDFRGECRPMDIDGALNYARTTALLPVRIRIGGYQKDVDYGFSSRGLHPHVRSILIQNRLLVLMGWPVTDDGGPSMALNMLRRGFERFNIIHKYLVDEEAVDNDFYLVLGAVADELSKDRADGVCRQLQEELSVRSPVYVQLRHEDLSVVLYSEESLPLESSIRIPLMNDVALREQLRL